MTFFRKKLIHPPKYLLVIYPPKVTSLVFLTSVFVLVFFSVLFCVLVSFNTFFAFYTISGPFHRAGAPGQHTPLTPSSSALPLAECLDPPVHSVDMKYTSLF